MDETADGALVARLDGDDQTAVAHGELSLLVDPACRLGVAHDLADALLDATLFAAYALAYLEQLGGGVVGDLALVVDEAVGFGEDAAVDEDFLKVPLFSPTIPPMV